jgi:lipid A disaccharide synthetase
MLGRWLLTTKYLSLVNILANKELVPEFMPHFSSVKPVLAAIETFLKSSDKLAETSDALIRLMEPLVRKKASNEVAGIVVEMLR